MPKTETEERSALDSDIVARAAKQLIGIFNAALKGSPKLKDYFPGKGPIRVLDVGCGQFSVYMVRALQEYFGKDRIEYLGVDNDLDEILLALRALSTSNGRGKVSFELIDATNPDNLTSIEPGSIDFAVLRHPDMEDASFRQMIDVFIPMFLKKHGVFFITAYDFDTITKAAGAGEFKRVYQPSLFPSGVVTTGFEIHTVDERPMDTVFTFGRVNLCEAMVRKQVERRVREAQANPQVKEQAKQESPENRANGGEREIAQYILTIAGQLNKLRETQDSESSARASRTEVPRLT